MEKFIELGFVCQVVLDGKGDVVSTCVRDARNGNLLYAGFKDKIVEVMMSCIDDASRSMVSQVKAMEDA